MSFFNERKVQCKMRNRTLEFFVMSAKEKAELEESSKGLFGIQADGELDEIEKKRISKIAVQEACEVLAAQYYTKDGEVIATVDDFMELTEAELLRIVRLILDTEDPKVLKN
jgi:hypothetical protein